MKIEKIILFIALLIMVHLSEAQDIDDTPVIGYEMPCDLKIGKLVIVEFNTDNKITEFVKMAELFNPACFVILDSTIYLDERNNIQRNSMFEDTRFIFGNKRNKYVVKENGLTCLLNDSSLDSTEHLSLTASRCYSEVIIDKYLNEFKDEFPIEGMAAPFLFSKIKSELITSGTIRPDLFKDFLINKIIIVVDSKRTNYSDVYLLANAITYILTDNWLDH